MKFQKEQVALPFHYSIDKERRLVTSTGSGTVTAAEIKAHQDRLLGDPNFDPDFNQLIDMSNVSALHASPDGVKSFARRTVFSGESRRAWVASAPAIFGMGRLAAAQHELSEAPFLACVFYDLPSAFKWLGLSDSSSI